MQVEYDLVNRSKEPARARFAVCIPLNLDSLISDQRRVSLQDGAACAWDEEQEGAGVSNVLMVFGDHSVSMRMEIAPAAEVQVIPVRIPARYPEGMVSEFQGLELWLSWPLQLWGTERTQVRISLAMEDYSSGSSNSSSSP